MRPKETPKYEAPRPISSSAAAFDTLLASCCPVKPLPRSSQAKEHEDLNTSLSSDVQ